MAEEQKRYTIEFVYADNGQYFGTNALMTKDEADQVERILDQYEKAGAVEQICVGETRMVDQGFDGVVDEIADALASEVSGDGTSKCQNCERIWPDEVLITPIPDIEQRVTPGEIMPSGECPACGAVCHIVTPEPLIVFGPPGIKRSVQEPDGTF